jgi:hypothetical protein
MTAFQANSEVSLTITLAAGVTGAISDIIDKTRKLST